jgi:hypothetical protein
MVDSVKSAKVKFAYYLKKDIPVYIEGPPGVGKSEMVAQVAKESGIGFIDVRLGQMDPVDLRGLPTVLTTDDDTTLTSWARPDFWPLEERDGPKGIMLLDELGDCGKAMQSAAYQVILNHCAGPHRIPKGWYIAAAGNNQKHKAGAQPMSSALANRFAHLEIEADWDCFREYGNKVGLNPLIIGFTKFRPNMLHNMEGASLKAFPTPRSWFRASLVCDAPGDIRMGLVAGCVGEGAAGEFEAFLKTIDLPDFEEIVANPKKTRIPDNPSHKYALASMLAQHVDKGTLGAVIQYCSRPDFGRDFEICTILDAVKRDNDITDCKAFTEFANRNQELIV